MDVLDEIQLLTDDEINNLCKDNLPAENRFKLLAFFLCHQKRNSKVVNVANITLNLIRTLRELRDYESSYKAPDNPPTINANDWP